MDNKTPREDYSGKTFLRDFWEIVKENFKRIFSYADEVSDRVGKLSGEDTYAGCTAFKITAKADDEALNTSVLTVNGKVDNIKTGSEVYVRLVGSNHHTAVTAIDKTNNLITIPYIVGDVNDDYGSVVVSDTLMDGDIEVGENAHTEGYKNISAGDNSHSEGAENIAFGDYSHAGGRGNIALGDISYVEGGNNTAAGHWSHVEGNNNEAIGNSGHAEGRNCKATGICSHAEGYGEGGIYNEAGGIGAHVEGISNSAKGKGAHAEGKFTVADYDNSHTEGEGTVAACQSQHVQGRYNAIDIDKQYAHIVGNGSGETVRSNAYTLDWDGNACFAGEVKIKGGLTVAAEKEVNAKLNKHNSVGSGYISYNPLNDSTKGEYSVGLGYNNEASGNKTVALGEGNTAKGINSACIGKENTVSGSVAAAIGYGNTVSGEYGLATGRSTAVNGRSSAALGEKTSVSGKYSIVGGYNTEAKGDSQLVVGTANIPDENNEYAVIVGNGEIQTSPYKKITSNAYTLSKKGDGWFAGGVTANGETVINAPLQTETIEVHQSGVAHDNWWVQGNLTCDKDVITNAITLCSSTEGSTKKFKLTIDDSGSLAITEIKE